MGHPIRGRQELSDLAAPRTGKQQLTNGGEPWVPAKEFEGRPSPFINLEKTELALIVMASVRIAAKVKPASCSTAALHIGQLLRSTPLRAIAKLRGSIPPAESGCQTHGGLLQRSLRVHSAQRDARQFWSQLYETRMRVSSQIPSVCRRSGGSIGSAIRCRSAQR